MKYVSSSPTRIDLAGGTLDIWPIYVFEEGGLTINAAIDLFAHARLTKRPDKKVVIISKNVGKGVEAENISRLQIVPELDLPIRLVKWFSPDFGFELEIETTAPFGSGLGGSSAVAISIATLFNKLTGKLNEDKKLIEMVSNIEAKSIGIPTGKQDYHPSLFGGVNAIHFGMEENKIEDLNLSENFLKELNERLILCYTGAAHFSAINNWAMLKRYVEDSKTREAMRKIKETSMKMRDALLNENFDKLAEALNEEWNNRKNLSDSVSTPAIERIILESKLAGAVAAKVCGAGGGGCMIVLAGDGKAAAVRKAVENAGGQVIDYKFALEGTRVRKI